MDVILKVISTVDSKLASLEQKDGQLIFCKDTRKILLDLNGVRTVYEQITTINTESQRTEILAPVDGFYFVLDTHILWRYSAEWIQITSQPADVVKINQGSSNSGKFLGIGPDGNVVPVDAPSGGTVDTEQIEQAVDAYLEENPVSGMTAEQEQQLNQNTSDVYDLKSVLPDKLDTNQGPENKGKSMVVGEDGALVPENIKVNVDSTLSNEGEAADAKIVGDELDKKINKSGWSSNKFLGTNESGNIIEKDAPEGESIPNGGTTGQVLTKKSNSDKDVSWADPTVIINKASESNLGGVKVKNATEEQTVFVGIDSNGFLKVNESETPSDYNTVKNNSEKIALDKTDTYSIANNRDEIFNSIETSKSKHISITDGSDYWDADEAALYPSVLSMEQIRKNRFYANMWLPNGLEIEQDYRYASNKNGHIRLYDIKTQKTDLTGIGPWGICLRSEGKNFPTSEINFIISAFRILGLNSETGKWELIKKQRPIAAIYDIEKTSSEGTYLQLDREDLGNDMYQFPVRNASNWIIDGSEMCFHFYNQLEDAISSDDLEPYSKIIVAFRMRVKEEEYSNVFTCSAGCDAYGSSSDVEAFFSRFNAVTNRLLEYNATNCLEKESMLISDNLLYINELLSDENDSNSGGELTPEPTPVQESTPYDGKTIIAFGDSIVAGWGWQEGYGITQPLKEKYTEGVWINQAVSGSNMANKTGSEHPSIVSKVKAYSGNADAILLEGGTNDVNNGITLGTISSGYDDAFDENTFTGALESCLRTIMNKYPLAYKFFLIPHNYAKDNSYVDSYHDRAKEVCEKWNMPVLDMRKRLQIAMTAQNKSNYTLNPNTDQGDGVHPTELLYRKFYSPLVDQFFRLLGMLDDMSGDSNPPTPENVPVTGVTLNKHSLSLTSVDQSEQLVATVSPPNATNKAVTWESDHVEYATVTQGGLVEAVATGSAVITVKTQDGNKTDICQVTVDIQEPGGESYTELDYIQLDKNCYFDVGITPDVNTNTEISVHVDYPDPSGTYIAGARDSNYKYLISATDNYYTARGEISSAGKNFRLLVTSNVDIVFKQEGNTAYANENSVQFDAISALNLTSHYIIGNCSNGSSVFSGQGLLGKIYYAKIYSGEDLVRDLIPVRKNQSNELCLYDKISETYYSNLGTGTLIGSDEI